jgi:hypothetical protein
MTENEKDLNGAIKQLSIICIFLFLLIAGSGQYNKDRIAELEKRIVKLEKRK